MRVGLRLRQGERPRRQRCRSTPPSAPASSPANCGRSAGKTPGCPWPKPPRLANGGTTTRLVTKTLNSNCHAQATDSLSACARVQDCTVCATERLKSTKQTWQKTKFEYKEERIMTRCLHLGFEILHRTEPWRPRNEIPTGELVQHTNSPSDPPSDPKKKTLATQGAEADQKHHNIRTNQPGSPKTPPKQQCGCEPAFKQTDL